MSQEHKHGHEHQDGSVPFSENAPELGQRDAAWETFIVHEPLPDHRSAVLGVVMEGKSDGERTTHKPG